ncbi:aspartate/glutamate racemase family protein [Robbsia sp. KACC 23696]|uniref:aspartate/glutamate racemase family protein n=1 Tax=Robbsia sp. KACC 23696 TaxID=3149231 RepID=UPI00325B70B2
MKINVVNPNTSASMTQTIADGARRKAAPGTTLRVVNPDAGPPSIEGWYDDAMAIPGLLTELKRGEAEGAQAHVIACFGDPGLYAARECVRGPVLGIAEAAMHVASLVAPSFTIVTTLSRVRDMTWHLVDRYGMRGFCRNVRAIDVAVLALDEPGSDAREKVLQSCRDALEEDHAEAIVLGCAGMVDFCAELEQSLGVPVIDGVTAAVKLAEALVGLGVHTSKRSGFAFPLPKAYSGTMAPHSPQKS